MGLTKGAHELNQKVVGENNGGLQEARCLKRRHDHRGKAERGKPQWRARPGPCCAMTENVRHCRVGQRKLPRGGGLKVRFHSNLLAQKSWKKRRTTAKIKNPLLTRRKKKDPDGGTAIGFLDGPARGKLACNKGFTPLNERLRKDQ